MGWLSTEMEGSSRWHSFVLTPSVDRQAVGLCLPIYKSSAESPCVCPSIRRFFG